MEKMEVETMLGRDHFLDERIVEGGGDKLVAPELRGRSAGW